MEWIILNNSQLKSTWMNPSGTWWVVSIKGQIAFTGCFRDKSDNKVWESVLSSAMPLRGSYHNTQQRFYEYDTEPFEPHGHSRHNTAVNV